MQIAWRRGLFPVLVALGVCLTVTTGIRAEELPPREGNLRPDEVLVVANALSEESLAVARHYMARRNIPADHLFRIRYADFDALEPMDQNPKWMPFDQFREDVAEPLEAFLETSGLRDRILCLVCVVDTPYRVGGFDLTAREHYELETRLSHPAYRRASAEAQEKFFEKQKRRLWEANSAFDSELAWRFLPEPSPMDRAGLARREGLWRWFANPYCGREESFRAFRRRQIESGRPERLYMVARLDGLSAENAMGLVDKAIQAEREGVAGTAYFDARNEGHKKKGYGLGDWWIRRAWEITRRAGLPTERNTDGGQFAPGTCQDALIYWGFYHPFHYRGDLFEHRFPVGAIACHVASFEAANIHRYETWGEHIPWCSGFLHDGITVTIGPVAEPYLLAFPQTEPFFTHLYQGWSVGEAYWSSIAHTSWRLILVGDPLYAPFAHAPLLRPDALTTDDDNDGSADATDG